MRSRRSAERALAQDCGSAIVSSVFGVAVLLTFLLVASQALVHLYATSTVTAVAFDVARVASAVGGRCPSAGEVRARLGKWGTTAEVHCTRHDGGATSVTISGRSPANAFGAFSRALGVGGGDGPGLIERSATFRTEG